MVTTTSAGFIACFCFLVSCDLVLSGYGVLPSTTTTPPPPSHNHNHNHNHGQGNIHGNNHGVHQPSNTGRPVFSVTTVRPHVPVGYRTFPGVGSYKFHAFGTPWNNAKKTCNREGTKMLIVNSRAESEAIKTLFRENPNSPGAISSKLVWVGAQEKGRHGEFITNDGQRLEQVAFLRWSKEPPQPNDFGHHDCVSFYLDGTHYDDACNLMYPFVCEA